LRSIQDWIVRRQLLGLKGVAEVSSFGGKLKLICKLGGVGITAMTGFIVKPDEPF